MKTKSIGTDEKVLRNMGVNSVVITSLFTNDENHSLFIQHMAMGQPLVLWDSQCAVSMKSSWGESEVAGTPAPW